MNDDDPSKMNLFIWQTESSHSSQMCQTNTFSSLSITSMAYLWRVLFVSCFSINSLLLLKYAYTRIHRAHAMYVPDINPIRFQLFIVLSFGKRAQIGILPFFSFSLLLHINSNYLSWKYSENSKYKIFPNAKWTKH